MMFLKIINQGIIYPVKPSINVTIQRIYLLLHVGIAFVLEWSRINIRSHSACVSALPMKQNLNTLNIYNLDTKKHA